MRKKILCLLLLLALCASGHGRRRWNSWDSWDSWDNQHLLDQHFEPEPAKPKPVSKAARCCGHPYASLFLALFQQSRNCKFRKFFKLHLQYALLLKHRAKLTWKGYWNPFVFQGCLWRKVNRKLKHLKKVLWNHYPKWVKLCWIKHLRKKIVKGSPLRFWLRKRFLWVLKNRLHKCKDDLKKVCHKLMKKAKCGCGHIFPKCWYRKLCEKLREPTTTTAPTTTPTTTCPTTTPTTTTPTTTPSCYPITLSLPTPSCYPLTLSPSTTLPPPTTTPAPKPCPKRPKCRKCHRKPAKAPPTRPPKRQCRKCHN